MLQPSLLLILLVKHIEGGLLLSAGMTALPRLVKDQPPRGWTIAWIIGWPLLAAAFVGGVLCMAARRGRRRLSRASVRTRG
ncbi:MAG TPA: hypothetical protein VJ803_04800 [Gemmatimonadaceae bacterium]|jgi:hypothetical protein|nr:hypothetical protein [Gemmatimonadaceae bacterium]